MHLEGSNTCAPKWINILAIFMKYFKAHKILKIFSEGLSKSVEKYYLNKCFVYEKGLQ
jgi:hypothetical protein